MATLWVAIYLFYSRKSSPVALSPARRIAAFSQKSSPDSSGDNLDAVSSGTVAKKIEIPNPPFPVSPTLKKQIESLIDSEERVSQAALQVRGRNSDAETPVGSGNSGPDLKNFEDDYSNQINSDLNDLNQLNSNMNTNSDIGNSDIGNIDTEGR